MLGKFRMRLSRLKRDVNEGKDGSYERIYSMIAPSHADDESDPARRNQGGPRKLGAAGDDDYLRMLHPIPPKSVAEEFRCLPRTRQSVFAEIYSWLDSDSGSNIFLLTGCFGTGKTAIASTLLTELEHQQRMAASFLFDRYHHDPAQLWPTIASSLASFHPVLSAEIAEAVRREPSVVESIESSFENLIKAPLVTHAGRLSGRWPVIVLDGVDCIQTFFQEQNEYSTGYRAFLLTLLRWQELPSWAKLFITARPTQGSNKFFEAGNVKRIDLPSGSGAIGTETDGDIGLYVTYRLAKVKKQFKSSLPSSPWPSTDQIAKIKAHAAGMFMWAKAAMDFVAESPDPDRSLASVVASGTGLHMQPIDTLYADMVNESVGYMALPGFRTTVGSIALARSPLSLSDLYYLFPRTFKDDPPSAICMKLTSIISCTGDEQRLQIRHRLFSEYLMDPKRSGDSLKNLVIDRSRSNRSLAYACLRVMLNELKFNICEVESSHVANSDIPDIKNKIKEHIPSHLSYACRFLPEHLRDVGQTSTADENDLLLLVQRVLRSRLLYWFEVLSFIEAFDDASRLLLLVAEWLEGTDGENALLAADASRFAQMFHDPITTSASHIYITGLSFCPSESLVSQLYKGQYPRLLSIWNTPRYLWASTLSVIWSSDSFYTAAVSADGKRIAISVNDGLVQIRLATTNTVLASLNGHTASVGAMTFSPNGKRLITSSDDCTIRVWDLDATTVSSSTLTGHSDWVRAVAISSDGSKIASASDDRTVRLWSTGTCTQLLSPMEGHTDWVRAVTFFPDGEKIVSAGDDWSIRVWNAETGESIVNCFHAHEAWVKSVAISPDGKMAVTCAADGTIKRWDAETLSALGGPLLGHEGSVESVSFAPNSKLIVSAGADSTVRLWNAETGSKFCSPLLGHTALVKHASFSSNGLTIYSLSQDSVRLWDRDNLPVWNNQSEVPDIFHSVALSADGRTVIGFDCERIWNWDVKSLQTMATQIPLAKPMHGMRCAVICTNAHRAASAGSDNAVYIWDSNSGRLLQGPLKGHLGEIVALAISSDGTRVVSGSTDNLVRIWDADTGESTCGPLHGYSWGVTAVVISPDGSRLAVGDKGGYIRICNMADGQLLWEPPDGTRCFATALSFSPDGRLLAIGAINEVIWVWDIESGKSIHKVLPSHPGSITCVAFSTDGKRIVSGGESRSICIWDADTGEIVCGPLEGHGGTVTSVTFSKNDDQVISGSIDATIRVWDVHSKDHRSGFFKGHEDWVHTVGFSPDGAHIASGSDDKTVRVRNVLTGSDVYPPLEGHEDWIRSLSFSPDGKFLVTGSDDCTLRIWDAHTGGSISGGISGHSDFVRSVAFAPDSLHVISGSEDSTVRVWKFSLDVDGKLGNTHPTTIFTHHTGVNFALYSPNGRSQASGAQDGMVHVTSTTTLVDERYFKAHDSAVLSLAYSPDGRRLFSSSKDMSIRVWDVETGSALLSPILGHTGPVYSIALCPDGRTLVSGSGDTTVRMWNTDTGIQLCMPLRGHTDTVFSVVMSPDGMRLVSGSADCAVAVWDVLLSRNRVWPSNFRRRIHDKELCAADSAGLYTSRLSISDGWVRGMRNERLFWVPPMYRAGLWMPRTTDLLGAPDIVVDMERFVHGTEWVKCREVPG
ncbi:WD40 repeat-like protein [Dentipellis sp. KUC8613]|nr:WD40 repeat-like protein [Dentipellis sp. KUC8613]